MHTDVLAAAVTAVPREYYTDHPVHGNPPQTTAQFTIERDILSAAEGLDLAGARILEIGTGTGYTGALLAELAGPGGAVTSIDIDPHLVARARTLHAERGCPVHVVLGDGHDGVRDTAPYDLIIGWCTPTHIPDAWVKQVRPGGVISTPVYVAPVARTTGRLRVTVTEQATLTDPRLSTTGYVDMGRQVNKTLETPLFYVDAMDANSWLSVAWRGRDDDPRAALALLNAPGHVEPYPFGVEEQRLADVWRDVLGYFAARDHALGMSGLTVSGSGAPTWDAGVGFCSGRDAAMVTDGGQLRASGVNAPALAKLRDYLAAWEGSGRPGLEQLTAVVEPGPGGWQVRATLPGTPSRR